MESRNNEEEKKKKKKKEKEAIQGLEAVREETKSSSLGDGIKKKKKKKRRRSTEDSIGDTSGIERNKNVNLEESRIESSSDGEKKKKTTMSKFIGEAEINEKTKSAMDKESTDGDEFSKKKRKKMDGAGANLEETEIELAKNETKKKKKRKKKKDIEEVEVSEKSKGKEAIDSKKKRKKMEGTVNDPNECEDKKRRKKRDKDNGDKMQSGSTKKKPAVKTIEKDKKKSRKVRFSGDVKVFPPSDDPDVKEYDEGNLVRGKRFSPAEDKLIKETIQNYIDINQLGEEGVEMLLYVSKHPQVKGCWKEICCALPWRPENAVYQRARLLLQTSGKRGFTEEEREFIREFHANHGPSWVKLAQILGKHRIHVKDAWRRFRLPNRKPGKWSEDEYQTLFDLVNLDLRVKSFGERKKGNGMIRENISWEAISEKMSTRTMSSCCHKWYDALTSPLVRQGEWADTDDYRLIDALQKQDACDVEDVDWDHLLESRSGEVCRKRWDEMVRLIGGNRERSFIEKVDVLSKRYDIDMLQCRVSKEEEVAEE